MKLLVLDKFPKLVRLNQNRILMKACFESEFGYSPDIWMFTLSGSTKNKSFAATILKTSA